jgi:hypothetical protein
VFKWDVPPNAMDTVGSVTFAIAITNTNAEDYVWQTVPSSFKISENIGLRTGYPSGTATESLAYTKLAKSVEDLETFVGNKHNDNPDDDLWSDVVIVAGTSSDVQNEEESE